MNKKFKPTGIVYSTNHDFVYNYENEDKLIETLPPEKQQLKVYIDRKQRGGKVVSLIEGFVGCEDDLASLAKLLKTRLGVGGSTKDGTVIIQGDFRDKIVDILDKLGYKVKKAGG